VTDQPVTLLQVVVGGAVVVAAAAAVLTSRRLAAVVAFLVFGVLLSSLWALMGAPDVALAEAAIGTGVTSALFLTVITRRVAGRPEVHASPPAAAREARGRAGAGLLSLVVAGALAAGLAGAAVSSARGPAAPPGAPGLGAAVDRELPATGVSHPVTGVLLGFRSYDTFLEVVVLLVAVLAVVALSRSWGRAGGGERPTLAATEPLTTFVRLAAPVLGLLVAWLLFAGSSRTGGAFQAGAVLAATLVLLHVSGLVRLDWAAGSVGPLLLGVAAFLLLGVAGQLLEGSWFATDPAWAGPVTVLLESLLTVTIGVALALAYVLLGRVRRAGGASG
jgi:multisubunit Na+/H+ antiporter MnhB subunit